jgi:hypothetical protein
MAGEFTKKATTELVFLLLGDGVDHEELEALVRSAFADGVNLVIKHWDEAAGQGDT